MRFFSYLLAAAVLVAAPWFAAAQAPGSFEYRPYVGLWGADSKRKNIDYHRVMKRDELTKVWLAHVGVDRDRHSDYYNKARVPEVDFERCMVLAIFRGQMKNSAGVKIVSITESADSILVRFDDRAYKTANEVHEVTPYGFFVLPRSNKLMVLEENVQNRTRGKPVWKERARFKPVAAKQGPTDD